MLFLESCVAYTCALRVRLAYCRVAWHKSSCFNKAARLRDSVPNGVDRCNFCITKYKWMKCLFPKFSYNHMKLYSWTLFSDFLVMTSSCVTQLSHLRLPLFFRDPRNKSNKVYWELVLWSYCSSAINYINFIKNLFKLSSFLTFPL